MVWLRYLEVSFTLSVELPRHSKVPPPTFLYRDVLGAQILDHSKVIFVYLSDLYSSSQVSTRCSYPFNPVPVAPLAHTVANSISESPILASERPPAEKKK